MEQMTLERRAADTTLPYVLVDQPQLDLTVHTSGRLELSFASTVWDSELFLVIDLYSAANPVHPAGHVGWWKWPLESKGDLGVEVLRTAEGFEVTFDGVAPQEFWKNPDFAGTDEPVIALHVVLRPVISEAVRFDDIVYVYNSSAALAATLANQNELENPRTAAPSAPWYVWPRHAMVHVVATNIYGRDAVGNFALALHRLLRANGVGCQLYAGNFDPALRGTIRHTCELFNSAHEDDLIFVNFSIFDPWLPRVVELAGKKLLYFHNITPPRFLQVYDAEYADHCADGIAQLKLLDRFDIVMANSASSARVLTDTSTAGQSKSTLPDFGHAQGPFEEASRLLQQALVAVETQSRKHLEVVAVPPMIGTKRWEEISAQPIDLPPEQTLLLYVGRIAPHKRIEDLFALFDSYQKLNPDSALLIVGGARFDGYVGFLRYLLDGEYAKIKSRIHLRDSVSDGQLKTLYQRASALVTMSEHEGFCVPVVEAMAFDKPVFAFAEPAVVQTLGQSGRLFFSKDFQAVAGDIDSVLTTPWLQQLVIESQRARLAEIENQSTGRALWTVFEKVVYGAGAV